MTWIKVMRKSMIGVKSKEIMAMFFGREMWRLEGKKNPYSPTVNVSLPINLQTESRSS